MMNFRPYLLLSVALVLLTGVSCTREEVPGLPGRITLTLNTAEEETKAAIEFLKEHRYIRDDSYPGR